MDKLTPINDYILVKPFMDNFSSSVIEIVDLKEVKSPQKGKVLAVGNDNQHNLKPNDLIIFKKYEAELIEITGKDYALIKQKDILVKVEGM